MLIQYRSLRLKKKKLIEWFVLDEQQEKRYSKRVRDLLSKSDSLDINGDLKKLLDREKILCFFKKILMNRNEGLYEGDSKVIYLGDSERIFLKKLCRTKLLAYCSLYSLPLWLVSRQIRQVSGKHWENMPSHLLRKLIADLDKILLWDSNNAID